MADVECQGQDVANEQVRSGPAWFYVKYGKGHEHLRGLEAEARDARRGLWSVEAVAPWEWRRSSSAADHRAAAGDWGSTGATGVERGPGH